MVESLDASRRVARHASEDAEIIQLAPQLAGGLIDEVSARCESEWREARSETQLAGPCAQGMAGYTDAVQFRPANSGAIQAKADGSARDAFGGARARKFSLFDGGNDSVIAQKRCRGIVAHR